MRDALDKKCWARQTCNMKNAAVANLYTNGQELVIENTFEHTSPIVDKRERARSGFDAFPSTRFYGSKRRQLPWLCSVFAELPGKTILDACGGTGTVSLLLSNLGKQVTYNDVFAFNQISATALFGRKQSKPQDLLVFLDQVRPVRGFISKTFKGMYFTDDENHWLDGIMSLVVDIDDAEWRAMILYCLFQACLKKRPFNLFHRANLSLRHSIGKVKFGNRTTWDASFSTHMMGAHAELLKARALVETPVNVLPAGSADVTVGNFDIVYLDPPYFNSHRQTESYLHRYHFLEGLARYEEWPRLLNNGSPILQLRDEAVPGEWRSKGRFESQLLSTLDRYIDSTIVLSYVAEAHPSESTLKRYFEERFSQVQVIEKPFNRALSKRSRMELIFVGQNL